MDPVSAFVAFFVLAFISVFICVGKCIHICICICICICIWSILDIFVPTKVVKFTPIFFLFLGQEAFLPSLTRLAARIENLLRICWRASEKDLWEYQIGFICFPTQLLPNFFLPIYRIQSQSLPNKTHHWIMFELIFVEYPTQTYSKKGYIKVDLHFSSLKLFCVIQSWLLNLLGHFRVKPLFWSSFPLKTLWTCRGEQWAGHYAASGRFRQRLPFILGPTDSSGGWLHLAQDIGVGFLFILKRPPIWIFLM